VERRCIRHQGRVGGTRSSECRAVCDKSRWSVVPTAKAFLGERSARCRDAMQGDAMRLKAEGRRRFQTTATGG